MNFLGPNWKLQNLNLHNAMLSELPHLFENVNIN